MTYKQIPIEPILALQGKNSIFETITNNGLAIDLFPDRNLGTYLQHKHIYLAAFAVVPHGISEGEIDCYEAVNWMLNHLGPEVKDSLYSRAHFHHKTGTQTETVYFYLKEDLLICIQPMQEIVRFLFRRTPYSAVEPIIREILRFRLPGQQEQIPE